MTGLVLDLDVPVVLFQSLLGFSGFCDDRYARILTRNPVKF